MNKYAAAAGTSFKAQMAYRFDVALTALSMVWRVLFAFILWGAVFAGKEEVAGFTFQGMLSYYLISAFLKSIDLSEGVFGEVSARIREGTFSKYMVIPADPRRMFLGQSLGAGGYYALFSVLTALFCAVVFRIEVHFAKDFAALLCAGAMALLGLMFMVCYQFLIGLMAFRFQDVGFFIHVQGSVIALLTGVTVPLSLMPAGLQSVLRLFPFTYVAYTPTMLLTGQIPWREGLYGLCVLGAWTAGMYLFSGAVYHRLRVRYEGVGI